MFKQTVQDIWHSIVRIFAFVSKEARLMLHQPRLVFTLILGPFLILLIFGIGYRNTLRELKTLFVVPEDSEIEQYVETFSDSLPGRIEYAGLTHDPAEARRRLRDQEVDLVVVTPRDPMTAWEADERSTLTLYHNEIDPIEEGYVAVSGQQFAEQINRQILYSVVSQSQDESVTWQDRMAQAKAEAATTREALAAGDAARAQSSAMALEQELNFLSMALGSGAAALASLDQTGQTGATEELLSEMATLQQQTDELLNLVQDDTMLSQGEARVAEVEDSLDRADELLGQFRDVDPSVMVAPFRSETSSLTQVDIDPMHFYVPAVIALLLQHMAVTLGGLSIIREKLTGAMELFRASPLSAFEMLAGKYTSYLLLLAVLTAVLTALIVLGLQVPQLSPWLQYALVIIALLLASMGIGFHISLSAQSNSQAIQYGMLILLAAIFFSGFFLPLYRLTPAVQVVSWLMPATYGTVMLQDVMLRGRPPQLMMMGALFLMASVLLLLAWWRLRRQLAKV